jgi:putative heme-binding domain-containing protein
MTSVLLSLVALLPTANLPQRKPDTTVAHGLRVPAGFEVILFADSKLANDIHCMTIDPRGRVIVAGPGYLRILIADERDGKADRALDFAQPIKQGAHGLLWEGDDLWAVGDGGLRRYRKANGAGRQRPSELLFKCNTGGEHTAHAVRRGPDGWLYLLVGDHAGITRSHATLSTSPVKDPIGGCVLRFSPDLKGCEIVADGYRNPYGMDFGSDGELFSFDSDNERCVSLPWYEPTRCYHVVPGGQHGWVAPRFTATWRRPPYFLDVVAPIATLGRGSPTGVVCYKHTQFPARYRGGLFLLDWTFGQVHFVTLERSGSSYAGKPEVFLRSVGDDGFAPTAAAVHPLTGDLYISIGGRGTRGAVYRIRYPAGLKNVKPADVAKLQPAPRSPSWKPGLQRSLLRDASSSDLHTRRRALEMILRHRDRFTAAQMEQVIRASAGQHDRGVQEATARLILALDKKDQQRIDKLLVKPHERLTYRLALPDWDVADLVKDTTLPVGVRLDAVRLVQRALGDLSSKKARGTVWEGYSRRQTEPALPERVRAVLRSAFPSGQPDLDRELSRTLALVEDDDAGLLARVAGRLTPRSHPTDDVHYLIVLARLKGQRSAAITRTTAEALLGLDVKIVERKLNRDSNWEPRLAEVHAALAARDSELNRAIVEHRDFGRADHVLWTRCPGFDRERAAQVFLARAGKQADFVWNSGLVTLVTALPAEKSLPVLRKLWGQAGLDDDILPILAKQVAETDHGKFLRGVVSPRLALVSAALGALEKLPTPAGTRRRDEAVALVRGLRQMPSGKVEDKLRARLLARLAKVAGVKLASADAALAWLAKHHPEQARLLASSDGVDVAAWKRRLAKVAWDKGDVKRGQAVSTKASCATCHSGSAALGPDLAGVTGRFSRDDLFTAILQPSKDVSPRYRTTQLTTAKGQVYQGIIVYEAVDSVILQTGPATTIRLRHAQISERRLTATSLMPVGLLDRLSDREIADLYAYLKSLGAQKKPEAPAR